MQEVLESLDYTPSQTCAESQRFEPGFEVLDGVVTKIAIDQEQQITSLVIVPTVAVEVSATVDPDADPLMTRLGAMTTPDLKAYIIDEIALGERVLADEKLAADEHKRIKKQRFQVTDEVICALQELKSRCKASKTWEKALKECGIAPSTWRSWGCRELNQLTTGKRTKSRKPKPDGRSLAQIQADVAAARAAVDARRAAAKTEPVDAEYMDDGPVATAQTIPDAPVHTSSMWLTGYEQRFVAHLAEYARTEYPSWLLACGNFAPHNRTDQQTVAEAMVRRLGIVTLTHEDENGNTVPVPADEIDTWSNTTYAINGVAPATKPVAIATAQDWSIDPDTDPGLSATEIYNDLMALGRTAETLAENVNLGSDLHWKFAEIQTLVNEVMEEIFDDGFDPAATGWMECSSELRKQRIQAIKKLMKKGSK